MTGKEFFDVFIVYNSSSYFWKNTKNSVEVPLYNLEEHQIMAQLTFKVVRFFLLTR